MQASDRSSGHNALVYVVAETGRRTGIGSTQPRYGSMAAVLKDDGPESVTCVYNELVAARLAELLDVPMAAGVLSEGETFPRFASLIAATPGVRLPPVQRRQARQVAQRYPEAVAAILAFDVFIANLDRAGNLKASTGTVQRFICGFDHSHALLTCRDSALESLAALAQPQAVLTHHLFGPWVDEAHLGRWVGHIQQTADHAIRRRCSAGGRLRGVSEELEVAVGDALIVRKAALATLCEKVVGQSRERA